jgi:hypothetical protein
MKCARTVAYTKTGLTAAMTIKAPPGSYSVRGTAVDALDGKAAASNGNVQVK